MTIKVPKIHDVINICKLESLNLSSDLGNFFADFNPKFWENASKTRFLLSQVVAAKKLSKVLVT